MRRFSLEAVALALMLLAGAAAAHEGHDKTISAGKLARDAKDFYNQTVTVSAEVEDVLDTHSFTLDEDVPVELQARVRQAQRNCPEGAIEVTD